MIEKEIREIRRRFRADKSMIASVYGCYVNEAKEIAATFQEPISIMPQLESEKFLGLLKKSISGSLGRSLVNIEFTAKQVMESEEYKLLAMMRKSCLKDEGVLQTFYERVAGTLNIEGNYLILLAYDDYTVPYRAKDDTIQADASDEVFSYFVCSICPVKLKPAALSFEPVESSFRAISQDMVVTAPELGFMFPLFDDRAANIYGTLYYTRNAADNHQEFIDTVFRVEPPMPAQVQKETFGSVLAEALGEECSIDVVQAVHEQIGELMDRHKESKEPEELLISKSDIGLVLQECGVSQESIQAFDTAFETSFGEDRQLPPMNVIDKKRFEIRTADTVVKVDPERSDLVEMRRINGVRYIMIPIDGDVEVNGVRVSVPEEE